MLQYINHSHISPGSPSRVCSTSFISNSDNKRYMQLLVQCWNWKKLTCNVIHLKYYFALFLVKIQETVLLISILRCKHTYVFLKQCYNFWQAYLNNPFLSTQNFSFYNTTGHFFYRFYTLVTSYLPKCPLSAIFYYSGSNYYSERSVKFFQKNFQFICCELICGGEMSTFLAVAWDSPLYLGFPINF